MYYLQVTVTLILTSDLVLRIIMSRTYLLYYLRQESHLVYICILEWRSVPSNFHITVTFTSDLVSRIGIESGAYLLYSLSRNPKFSIWMHL